jgi:hypothetical protein
MKRQSAKADRELLGPVAISTLLPARPTDVFADRPHTGQCHCGRPEKAPPDWTPMALARHR